MTNPDASGPATATPGGRPGGAPKAPAAGRRLAGWQFVVIVVVYLAIIQGIGLAIGVDTSGSTSQFPTTQAIVRNALVPIGVSVLFGAAVVTWLGWWQQVLHYHVPVQRWVRLVPVSMLVVALLGINYWHLADQQASLVVSLLVLGVFVGVGEELMFRGVGVQFFRRAGFSEGRTALYSSLVFGLVHVTNAIHAGPSAVVQALIVATSGYFFYLCLRVGGTILLPMLVHGLWDTSLFSGLSGPEPAVSVGMFLQILLQITLIVVLAVRRHRIEPATLSARA
ncbi:CPBP family intramembrane glutamic endopeptidase [Kitasatospora sp. NPDC057223]|uniref:CPBP family intramembrane glutamic endopeptidase n=1 Tax=Kitasatospora sp. NPDC057223 TaxID=3346055 RepID=UPI00363A29A7